MNAMRPVIEGAVLKILEVAEQVSNQARDHVSLSNQIKEVVTRVGATAMENARSSADTYEVTENTQTSTLDSSNRLRLMERECEDAERLIKNVRDEMFTLASHVEQIEEILGFNIEISQQIKILALNAGIEAAKAGKFGHGFRTVAMRLRQLIERTETNMEGSRMLLDKIRVETVGSNKKIIDGIVYLKKCFKDLTVASSLIESSAKTLMETTKKVAHISESASDQQLGMDGIQSAMGYVDEASAQLRESSDILQESIMEIVISQESMGDALGL